MQFLPLSLSLQMESQKKQKDTNHSQFIRLDRVLSGGDILIRCLQRTAEQKQNSAQSFDAHLFMIHVSCIVCCVDAVEFHQSLAFHVVPVYT